MLWPSIWGESLCQKPVFYFFLLKTKCKKKEKPYDACVVLTTRCFLFAYRFSFTATGGSLYGRRLSPCIRGYVCAEQLRPMQTVQGVLNWVSYH